MIKDVYAIYTHRLKVLKEIFVEIKRKAKERFC